MQFIISSKKNLTGLIILLSLLPAFLVAAVDEVYYDNEVHTCKSNEYFDVDYLKCKTCQTELNLVPSKDSEYFPIFISTLQFKISIQY